MRERERSAKIINGMKKKEKKKDALVDLKSRAKEEEKRRTGRPEI